MEELVRKYRPRGFKSVYGQENAVAMLKGCLHTGNIRRAVLIQGPWGTGKTTLARIYAKHICCLNYDSDKLRPCGECISCRSFSGMELSNHISISEINAAVDGGTDSIKQLVNNAKQKPRGKYRVYIIDEAHMLTSSAQSDLLKILEEPPEYTVFIFCTDTPEMLKATIQSRLTFKIKTELVSVPDLVSCLGRICEKENFEISSEILEKLAKASYGHCRDAVALLDNFIAAKNGGMSLNIDNIDNFIFDVQVGNPFKAASPYLKDIYSGKEAISDIVSLDSKGLFLLVTQCLSSMHLEAVYTVINKKLSGQTKDFWRFKEVNSFVSSCLTKIDDSDKPSFLSIMGRMLKDIADLESSMKTSSGADVKALLFSFSIKWSLEFDKFWRP